MNALTLCDSRLLAVLVERCTPAALEAALVVANTLVLAAAPATPAVAAEASAASSCEAAAAEALSGLFIHSKNCRCS